MDIWNRDHDRLDQLKQEAQNSINNLDAQLAEKEKSLNDHNSRISRLEQELEHRDEAASDDVVRMS